MIIIRTYILGALFILGSYSFANKSENSTSIYNATSSNYQYASSLISSTVKPAINFNKKSYVFYDKWVCGSGEFDKSLSHQMSESDCPVRMYETNLCCVAHDICYMDEDQTQEQCDSAFCYCLERTVHQAAMVINKTQATGCGGISNYFCFMVQVFGGAAHQSAKASSKFSTTTLKPTAMEVTAPKAMVTSTTVATRLTTTTQTPKEIVHFMTHNISLQCNHRELASCVEKMHECVRTQSELNSRLLTESSLSPISPNVKFALRVETESNSLLTCSTQFCECASLNIKNEYKSYGASGCSDLFTVCNEINGNKTVKASHNIHFWTIKVKVEYFDHQFGGFLMIFSGICVLIFLLLFCYFLIKLNRRLRFENGGKHLHTIVRPTDIGFNTWQRRQKRNSISAYSAFVSKKTSGLSMESECSNCKNIHSKILQISSHPHHNLIPMNSSKAQLINADENSTTSTPSINSNESN